MCGTVTEFVECDGCGECSECTDALCQQCRDKYHPETLQPKDYEDKKLKPNKRPDVIKGTKQGW